MEKSLQRRNLALLPPHGREKFMNSVRRVVPHYGLTEQHYVNFEEAVGADTAANPYKALGAFLAQPHKVKVVELPDAPCAAGRARKGT